ncbi:MAG: DUF5615 family PIN-like protein [Acidimicrobiales bacterium]
MRFKLDENIDVRAKATLAGAGHDVATVAEEGLSGATDPVIAATVAREDRVLVSFDRGFGDLRAYPPGTHPGIVVLRLRSQDLASVTAALGRASC